jgi:hypothetical protein
MQYIGLALSGLFVLRYPTQVSSGGPAQDICEAPLSIFYNGIYVLGDLWEYWRTAVPNLSVVDMFNFVEFDIADERSDFLRSLAYRGSWPPA